MEQKRRNRVARLFPRIESCERLVVRLEMNIHEEWMKGKKYMAFE
jgi:transposase-like protein